MSAKLTTGILASLLIAFVPSLSATSVTPEPVLADFTTAAHPCELDFCADCANTCASIKKAAVCSTSHTECVCSCRGVTATEAQAFVL